MSHSPERDEANCLNCDTEVIGRYCHVCGQENIDPRESFWSLVTHFFNDFTHFDGKFFKTLGTLARKPGFAAAEYMRGRRARYLHPIRMYLFTSFVFFLVFYTYTDSSQLYISTDPTDVPVDVRARLDTAGFSLSDRYYSSVAAYDSAQQLLPPNERDSWLQRKIVIRSITMNRKYKGDVSQLSNELVSGLIHSLPSLLFVSLPLFALVLKILYSRRNFIYADHAIYLIYLYIFMFILMLFYIGVNKTADVLNASWLNYLLIPLIIYGVMYSLLGMKNFYHQGWGKTTVKFVLFHIAAFFIILILFIIFLLLTFFRV